MSIPAHAYTPLSDVSKPDIDIVWLQLPDIEGVQGGEVLCVLQEVKTTGARRLDYAYELLSDYNKLFDTDPRFTPQTRLQAVKNHVEFTLRRPELCGRIARLAGTSPRTSDAIAIAPTLVHDRRHRNPAATLESREYLALEIPSEE
jgi:hypothetical protein